MDGKNSYQGYEVQKHRLVMMAKMYLEIAGICLALQLLLFLVLVPCRFSFSWRGTLKTVQLVPPLYRELLWKWPVAALCRSAGTNPLIHIHAPNRLLIWPHDPSGGVVVPARELTERIAYRRLFTAPDAHWGWALFLSFSGWTVWPLAVSYFARKTSKIKDDEHVRGARLISEAEIRQGLTGTGILPIGSSLIPESLSSRHILIAGQTGSGKSTILFQHLEAIQKAARRAIVNDFKGELVERFYRPEKDLILNPLDSRGLGWTIFNEIAAKPDLTAITGSLIPVAKGEDPFWCIAAQDVLRGVMAYCYEHGQRTNAELWKALTAPRNEVTEMCRVTPSGQAGYVYIQDASSKQAGSVIAVLMAYVSWLEFAADGAFSLRQWTLESADSTIYITNSEEVANIMRPYLSLFADLAGKRFLTLPENSDPTRKIYLLLDEMGNMQRLPSVKRLLTAGRSKGIVVEIGVPDFTSIESLYGREDAHTIVNSCGSKFVLNLGDPEAARYFSELAGEEEYWESSTFYSIAPNDNRGGENHNRQLKIRKVIMPAELQRLPPGQGYFLLPGGNPALVSIPWTAANRREPAHPPFLLRQGLSLDELQAKDAEITTLAENVKEGPVPEALREQVVENLGRRGRNDQAAVGSAALPQPVEEQKKDGESAVQLPLFPEERTFEVVGVDAANDLQGAVVEAENDLSR